MDEENKKELPLENEANMEASDSVQISFVPEEEESNPQAVIKKLREKLKACEKERQEYLEGWQRTKADFVNARKQDEADREKFIKFSEENLLKALIPGLQSLERALASEGSAENIKQGINMVKSQIMDALKNRGLEEINNVGTKFNPEEHQSTSVVEVTDPAKDHVVMEIVERGYKFNGRVIEPAKVVIGEFKKSESLG